MTKASDFELAYSTVKQYHGENNYINYLKYRIEKGLYSLSDFDVTYVLNNYDYVPYSLNKTVKISSDYAKKLKEKYELDFLPKKVRISKVIGEIGNTIHCYVQYRQSVLPTLMYVKKNYILNEYTEQKEKVTVDFDKYDEITKESGRKLKQVQKESVEFLMTNKKAILALSMGLGKSSVAVVSAIESKEDKVLIICPASLKSTWKYELSIYCDPNDIAIINGKEWDNSKKYTIVNYDILDNFYEIATETVMEEKIQKDGTVTMVEKQVKSRNRKKIKECLEKSPLFLSKFGCVIIDEAHKLSNNKSIRYKVISDFIKKSNPNYIFLLTGTPLVNKPINLYHILKLIDAEVTRDYKYYVTRYCGGKEMHLRTGKVITIMNGATNLDELREKIKHVYIRRLLSDMADMVNKSIETRFYELTDKQKAQYEILWNEYLQSQEENTENDTNPEEYRQLVEGMLVRQYLAKEMIPNTIKLVDEKLEDDEKVVVMCTFTEEIEKLKEYYGDKCVVYDGKMTSKAKDKAQQAFINNPKVKVFIGQIVAAGVGLTLTVAKTLVFNSYSWIYADNVQAEDRIYRLTQTEDVICIYQLFTDSVSQHMYQIVMEKGRISNELIKKEDEK